MAILNLISNLYKIHIKMITNHQLQSKPQIKNLPIITPDSIEQISIDCFRYICNLLARLYKLMFKQD